MNAKANQRMTDPHSAFVKLFEQNCHRHRPHAVFADFCEVAALAISNAVDLRQYEPREARYLQIAASYDREELSRFCEMLSCVTVALEGGMHDCLGKLFMELEMGNHWKGQFFTPYELCGLMARVTLLDARERVAERGFITISEPASGAGAMVIAMADALRETGLNYQQCMHATTVDVDATAAHMCYVQLSLLHVPAIVIVGNSLTLEERAHWYTPAHLMGGWGARLRRPTAAGDLAALAMPGAAVDALASGDSEPRADAGQRATTEPTYCLPMVQAALF
jgi:hypothetical protein